ncbi:50S ribosomal protein L29 [Desulfoglaeba alkanexedens]|jgi:large subunit ribosomal protein L29|uniref:Large ribosomal subunit protein uL29 n=1 Tax=Desulfoglaeba alkanexedens ALDC TaxID=980445 RepID=A0A4P8L027_9BACT|nr:50S ribosomal protein L29 [Desulfoglaeba alkanexedens]QCQ21050.1 50S ribosomal protein L29 [Desulfoglaeba alkanexedens ALDC]
MKARVLRDMSQEELRQKLAEIREALFNLKFQHATGQLENTAQLGKYRRDVARVLTVLREKEKS